MFFADGDVVQQNCDIVKSFVTGIEQEFPSFQTENGNDQVSLVCDNVKGFVKVNAPSPDGLQPSRK